MKHFKGIRNFLVDDGEYRHRLDKVKFGFKYNPATKKSDDVFATGPSLVSPAIKVKARAYHGPGVPHHHSNLVNESLLADIIIGIVGGVLGGFLLGALGVGGAVTGINLGSVVVAFIGAVILIAILRAVRATP